MKWNKGKTRRGKTVRYLDNSTGIVLICIINLYLNLTGSSERSVLRHLSTSNWTGPIPVRETEATCWALCVLASPSGSLLRLRSQASQWGVFVIFPAWNLIKVKRTSSLNPNPTHATQWRVSGRAEADFKSLTQYILYRYLYLELKYPESFYWGLYHNVFHMKKIAKSRVTFY